ncbi:hypothetical protein D3C80_1435440 [compost metagenome]
MLKYGQVLNDAFTNDQGVELIFNTRKIEAIATSFGFSAAYGNSKSRGSSTTIEVPSDIDNLIIKGEKALYGIHQPGKRRTQNITTTLQVNTHISKLGLVVSLINQFYLMNKSSYYGYEGYPIAYYDKDLNRFELTPEQSQSAEFAHLKLPMEDYTSSNDLPMIYSNYNLRVTKEIKKRLRISFNAYNVFNYRPEYYNEKTQKTTVYNSPPVFGAELSIKL